MNFTIVDNEVYLNGKLVTTFSTHHEAFKALYNEETRNGIELKATQA